ncbi:MAG: nucleotidyltransferase [Turicibacter sp.]|nr:nucleotidyltransferase [Turicibacter sp.]
MNVLGLIVEHNPLHNGHIHHINESKKLVNPDVTIAVMSGHFMQRGEPAITNKWHRAAFALEYGIDLVVELPYAFSNQSADLFATGAISLLAHLQATHVVFGSEAGSIEELTDLAALMARPDMQAKIKENMAAGLSLPAAFAWEQPGLSGPNNTLGIQYINAIKALGRAMIPLTIPRFASGYHDLAPTHDRVTSATAIREMLHRGVDVAAYTPIELADAHLSRQNWAHHYPFLRHKLLTATPATLAEIHDMVEGIENRLIRAAASAETFSAFMETVGTKRYTKTRVQRICANVLTGLTKAMVAEWQLSDGVPYVRILGLNEAGAGYLRAVKKGMAVPVYSTFGKGVHAMLQHELRVTASYASVYPGDEMTALMKREYTSKPVMLGF